MPNYTSLTDCATYQDKLFNGEPGITVYDVTPFNTIVALQRSQYRTNLTCRQHIVNGNMTAAWNEFLELTRSGESYPYYVEGYSYFLYVKKGFDWAESNLSWTPPTSRINDIYMAYQNLVAPDMLIPVPETWADDRGVLLGCGFPGDVDTGPYRVFRRSNSYLFINLDDSGFKGLFRDNMHVRPAYGSFVFYKDGSWQSDKNMLKTPRPYLGYAAESKEREVNNWNVPPGIYETYWRNVDWPNGSVWSDSTTTYINVRYSVKRIKKVWGVPVGLVTRHVHRRFYIYETYFEVKEGDNKPVRYYF